MLLSLKRKSIAYLNFIGIDLQKMKTVLKQFSSYKADLVALKKQKGLDVQFPLGTNRPVLDERFVESGTMSGHYFHQDLLIAKKIFRNNPQRHVDIGSRTDGFVAHVAVFREIEVFDIRPQESKVENIIFKTADLMQLPFEMENYCDSLSSLHAIEHFGLGRYGDPIDYNGHLKAIDNIAKILKSQGRFYFAVPIGPQRINFNAHRVFSIQYLLDILKDNFELVSFSYVNDKGDLVENADMEPTQVAENFGCFYGCGIFELIRK